MVFGLCVGRTGAAVVEPAPAKAGDLAEDEASVECPSSQPSTPSTTSERQCPDDLLSHPSLEPPHGASSSPKSAPVDHPGHCSKRAPLTPLNPLVRSHTKPLPPLQPLNQPVNQPPLPSLKKLEAPSQLAPGLPRMPLQDVPLNAVTNAQKRLGAAPLPLAPLATADGSSSIGRTAASSIGGGGGLSTVHGLSALRSRSSAVGSDAPPTADAPPPMRAAPPASRTMPVDAPPPPVLSMAASGNCAEAAAETAMQTVNPLPPPPVKSALSLGSKAFDPSREAKRQKWADELTVRHYYEPGQEPPVDNYRANLHALQDIRNKRMLQSRVELSFAELVSELDAEQGGEGLSCLVPRKKDPPRGSWMASRGQTWGQIAGSGSAATRTVPSVTTGWTESHTADHD